MHLRDLFPDINPEVFNGFGNNPYFKKSYNMTPEEKQKTDAVFAELTKRERQFLKEQKITPNEHGAYPFSSQDGNCLVAIDMFLASYLDWLIENGIVKQL